MTTSQGQSSATFDLTNGSTFRSIYSSNIFVRGVYRFHLPIHMQYLRRVDNTSAFQRHRRLAESSASWYHSFRFVCASVPKRALRKGVARECSNIVLQRGVPRGRFPSLFYKRAQQQLSQEIVLRELSNRASARVSQESFPNWVFWESFPMSCFERVFKESCAT